MLGDFLHRLKCRIFCFSTVQSAPVTEEHKSQTSTQPLPTFFLSDSSADLKSNGVGEVLTKRLSSCQEK